VAGRNLTTLHVNVVKLSIQDKLRILKSCPVSAQRPPTDGPLHRFAPRRIFLRMLGILCISSAMMALAVFPEKKE